MLNAYGTGRYATTSGYNWMVTLDDSLLVFDESVVGSALGHLTFNVPGTNAFIDTYVMVMNEEEVEQGSLNSTLKWSTTSSWKQNGDIYMFGGLSALDTSSQAMKNWVMLRRSTSSTQRKLFYRIRSRLS